MEIQCKSSAMQYPDYSNTASSSIRSLQAGQVDTHALYNWSEAQVVVSVQTAPVCRTPPDNAGRAICPTLLHDHGLHCRCRVIWGAVKLGDTSHRAHGTKVLTCTSVSAIVARNTDASQKRILFDSNLLLEFYLLLQP